MIPVNTNKKMKSCDVCLMEYSKKKKLFDHIKESMLDSFFRCEICNVPVDRDNIIVNFNMDWDVREKCNVCCVLFWNYYKPEVLLIGDIITLILEISQILTIVESR